MSLEKEDFETIGAIVREENELQRSRQVEGNRREKIRKFVLGATSGALFFLLGAVGENQFNGIPDPSPRLPIAEHSLTPDTVSISGLTLGDGAVLTIEDDDTTQSDCRARLTDRFSLSESGYWSLEEEYLSDDKFRYVKVFQTTSVGSSNLQGTRLQVLCVISLIDGSMEAVEVKRQ